MLTISPGVAMAHQWIQGPSESMDEVDRRLFFKLRNRLWDYEPLRASGAELALEVVHGVAEISGRVRTTAQKLLVTAFLRRIEGVRGVENNLVSDPEVVREVALGLARDRELAPCTLQVDSQLGNVRLVGAVPSRTAADRAVEIAQGLGIAYAVESHLEVTEQPAAAQTT